MQPCISAWCGFRDGPTAEFSSGNPGKFNRDLEEGDRKKDNSLSADHAIEGCLSPQKLWCLSMN